MERIGILCFLVFLSFSPSYLGEAVSVNNITCSGSTLHDFRIEGCSEQPCTIRKGQPLPFEVDMSFDKPQEKADNVYFNVFIPKYAKPPAVHGSSLITATCENQKLGFNCPIKSKVKYTLRSNLLIDSSADCTTDCENIGKGGTGMRETKWRWTIADSTKKASKTNGNKSKKDYSVCTFRVALNIVM